VTQLPHDPHPAAAHPRRRALKIAIQVLVCLAGVALLGWAITLALSPANREKLSALRDAPPLHIAALLGLSLLTQTINGLIFWVSLLPVRRLRLPDCLATNALCTGLAYMPFKLGALLRVAIHNRRDGVPLLTIGAWFAGIAIVLLLTFAPPVAASLVLKRIDATWVLATLAGEALLAVALIALARAFRGDAGITRLESLCKALHLHIAGRILRSRLWENLHTGFDMLADSRAVGASVALRLADIAAQGARFALAASILNITLPLHAAIVIALAYFAITIVSPFIVGLREAGVMKLAALMLPVAFTGQGEAFAPVPLFVTATEALVYLATAAAALAWLGPHRLLSLRAPSVASGAQPTS
jgi:hypothetical protein